MAILSTAIVACCAFVLLLEGMMWELFRHKAEGVCFQGGADTAFFRYFSLARVSLTVLLHTILLLVILIITFLLLW